MTDSTSSRHEMRTRFAQVPQWVYFRVDDMIAMKLYLHLAAEYCDRDRYCFPSEERLAKELGRSERTIRRALRILRDVGAVRVSPKSHRANGQWSRNAYVLPMDDPRDFAMHPTPDDALAGPEVDLSDQQKQGIVAARDQRSPDVLWPEDILCPTNQTQVKQPHPSKNHDPDQDRQDQRSKDEHHAFGHHRAAETVRGNILNDHAEDHSAAVPAGVQPPTAPSGKGLDQNSGVLFSQVSPPDDLARVPGTTLNEDYPRSVNDWMDQRHERQRDLIIAHVGELDPAEEHALESMLDRGEHWMKIVNTIRRQRGWGYVRA